MRRSDLRDLKRFELLVDFDEDDRRVLSEALQVCEMETGEAVFARGDPSDGLLLLAEGCVMIRCAGSGEIAHLNAGATLGVLSLVGEGRREADAETASQTRLFVLPRARFEEMLDAAPRTAGRLLQAILREQAALLHEAANSLD